MFGEYEKEEVRMKIWEISKEGFRSVFKHNIIIRGHSTGTNYDDAVLDVFLENVNNVADDIYDTYLLSTNSRSDVRRRAERWYDAFAGDDFLPLDKNHTEKVRIAEREARRARKLTGFNYRVNPRYRTDVGCMEMPLQHPSGVEEVMDKFYSTIAGRIKMVQYETHLPGTLCGYADSMMSVHIRPWAMFAEYNAAALAIWIAIMTTGSIPQFSLSLERNILKWRKGDYVEYYQILLNAP